jgi:hypothetical protein
MGRDLSGLKLDPWYFLGLSPVLIGQTYLDVAFDMFKIVKVTV